MKVMAKVVKDTMDRQANDNAAHSEDSITQQSGIDGEPKKNALDFRKYTKQIWLAGLGAFSRAEDEGNRLFDSLVKVGEELESKTSDIADNTVGVVEEVKGRVSGRVSDTKERVERALDERFNSTVSRIGFASHREVAQLVELIERLERKIDLMADELRQLSDKK